MPIERSPRAAAAPAKVGCEDAVVVNKGGSVDHTVVSGIKKWYAPEDLVGKTVVLVANLKPATLCGVESRGMILCAADEADENLSAVTTMAPMESGLIVR